MIKKKHLNNYPDLLLENTLLKEGYRYIIGIDEAGRGAWAGPLSVGAFLFENETKFISGIKDSKLLSNIQREKMLKEINKDRCFYSLISAKDIDKFGLTRAMKIGIDIILGKILKLCKTEKVIILIDGNYNFKFKVPSISIIKGDLKHYSIASASIIAKVNRDKYMCDLAINLPGYNFERHKGYGTKNHLMMISELGITNEHRKSFLPIKEFTTTKIYNK